MTTEDTQDQPQPEVQPEKPKRRRTSAGRKPAETQEQPSSRQNTAQTGSPSAANQAPAQQTSTPELSQLLRQQIAQAIQPVLADFRRQMADTVQQEIEVEQRSRTSPGTVQREASVPGREEPQQSSERPVSGGNGRQPSAETPPQPTGHVTTESDGGNQESVTHRFRTVASGALHLAEQQSEQWLASLLTAALDAMLTETTHQAVQRRAEQGLHSLLQKAFDAMPQGALSEEQQQQTERTLQGILHDTVAAVFAEGARASLHAHGMQASSSLAHGDVGSAVRHIGDAVRAILEELVAALRRQWQRFLRLLLRLILAALQDSLAPEEKDNLTDLSTESGGQAAG